jgi:hypothetical protein
LNSSSRHTGAANTHIFDDEILLFTLSKRALRLGTYFRKSSENLRKK